MARTIRKSSRPNPFVHGPTYQEMADPGSIPSKIRTSLRSVTDELDPLNLFNINWYGRGGKVRHMVLPAGLVGAKCKILVLIGREFPSGSHKVGAAYSTLTEGELQGEIKPGERTVLGPSTGNFGIGTAYVARIKGYRAIVIMPDSMSNERYERIRRYGGELELTPGTESDVILTLEKTYELKKDPNNYPLAQFELLPNYRFHRHVTGRALLEAAKQTANGRIACFVSAPGSAGTIAAGDAIKAVQPDCIVAAVEPRECATLYSGDKGQHRIEGIGDKMVTLIHNLLTTDHIVLVHDDDCVKGLYAIQEGLNALAPAWGISNTQAAGLKHIFGVSGICNVLAAVKMANYLDLGPNDTVATIATDGFDRYPSVLADLGERMGRLGDGMIHDRLLKRWGEEVFHGQDTSEILDVRGSDQKERLYKQKADVWTRFGYERSYLNRMKQMDFWDEEYEKIPKVDEMLRQARGF